MLSLKLPPLANHLSYLMLDKEVYPSYFRGIYSSPVQNLRDAANTLFVRDLCTFAVFAAVFMTAWGLYRYRKNEHAGMSVISPAVRVILKVMVSVLGALLCGLILSELFEYGRSGGKTLTVIPAELPRYVQERVDPGLIRNSLRTDLCRVQERCFRI